MATVYRVEHVDHGRGPYRGAYEFGDKEWYETARKMTRDHSDTLHPSTWEDGLTEVYSDNSRPQKMLSRHGFRSIEELMRWFDGWEETLHQNGFVIQRYDVSEGRYESSKRQTVFDPRYAVRK